MRKKSKLVFLPDVSRLYVLLFSLCCSVISFGQTVSGTVSDENGKKLSAVTVSVKGSSTGTTTDASGNYSIAAASNAILLFSSVGFTSQEISVNGRSLINVILATSAQALSEVIVTTLG
ncbi:MAG TPA: carboxypeptidase-like regulatory domain-containing protein, partial [Chitinophagaceae bacterium]|nr:carboxypeptidase-like regulatory domain-containing protein [Chitinophagaceae bacterium]